MPTLRDALKSLTQNDAAKVEKLTQEFNQTYDRIASRQETKAYLEADLVNKEIHADMKEKAQKTISSLNKENSKEFAAAEKLVERIGRVGGAAGKDNAEMMREKLHHLTSHERTKALKTQARGVSM